VKRAALALFIAVPAYAQDYPSYSSPSTPLAAPRFDRITIEDADVPGTAFLKYENTANQASDGGWFTVTSDEGIEVSVFIEINADAEGRERITVVPDDEYAAFPVEADVQDGEEVVIQITRPFS
jgi:hypothetical protein